MFTIPGVEGVGGVSDHALQPHKEFDNERLSASGSSTKKATFVDMHTMKKIWILFTISGKLIVFYRLRSNRFLVYIHC